MTTNLNYEFRSLKKKKRIKKYKRNTHTSLQVVVFGSPQSTL